MKSSKKSTLTEKRTVPRAPIDSAQPEPRPVPVIGNAVFFNSAKVAEMMGISDSTLRNYVWLQGLSKKERSQRFLQEPPAKMPRPKKIRGRLLWDAKEIQEWLSQRIIG